MIVNLPPPCGRQSTPKKSCRAVSEFVLRRLSEALRARGRRPWRFRAAARPSFFCRDGKDLVRLVECSHLMGGRNVAYLRRIDKAVPNGEDEHCSFRLRFRRRTSVACSANFRLIKLAQRYVEDIRSAFLFQDGSLPVFDLIHGVAALERIAHTAILFPGETLIGSSRRHSLRTGVGGKAEEPRRMTLLPGVFHCCPPDHDPGADRRPIRPKTNSAATSSKVQLIPSNFLVS